jgi:glycosyltransferase involved in cell wall biosynthesis
MRTGGAERIVVSLVRGAQVAGHSVALVSAPGELADELELDERHMIPVLRRRPWLVPVAAVELRRAFRSFGPDLVHCHNPALTVVGAIATLRGRRPPSLTSIHGVPEDDWPATSRLLRLSGIPVVACGPSVAEALSEHGYGVMATIPNAVGPAPGPAARAALEREWRIEPGMRLVLAVGRLVEAKNHALAVRALAHVPDAVLVIAGRGPLRTELEQLAFDTGVSERVVLAGLRPDARALMGAADAIVLPSRSEGLPLTVLEALASGTPLVATSVRGTRELLTDGRDALLVPPDEAAVAQALERVLADRELARRLAGAALEKAAAHSEEAMVAGYLDLYGRLVR